MAEKTIQTQETDPNPDLPDGPTQYDESLKISQLTTLQDPAASDYAVLARPNGDTFKVSLSTLRADLSAYKVKEVVKGTYIDNITETADGNGIWKINAAYQGSTSGNYVDSLNNASGDLTLSSSDGSILIDNRLRDIEDNLIEPPEYSSTIDLTLNTTTSTMFRAWIEVTELNKDGGTFNFNDTKITNENSIVTINGVVLEGSQYSLDAGVVTISNLTEVGLVVGDEIGVVSYTAEVPNNTFGNPTYGLNTSDISIVGEEPSGNFTLPAAIDAEDLRTQQDVNWYLLNTIENIEIPEMPDGIGGDQLVEEGGRLTIGFDDLPTDSQPEKGITLIHGELHRDSVESLDVKSGDDGILEIPDYDDPSVLDVEHGVWINGIREPTQHHSAARLYDVMTYYNRAVSWTNSKIEAIEIPDLAGYATEEWILDKSYITETVVTDAVDAQAQTQSTIDGSQDTKIETLENKVTALEGTVVEAQYKADTRDDPQLGAFVLKNMLDEKVLQFSQAVYIILSQTDFTNKLVDASKILNGDTIRLVMSPSNYANYTVTGVASRNGNIALEVTFMSAGSEGIVFDGLVYDFTHATPFDVGAACTKQYSDDQDEVTLNAAKAYTDSLELPELATNVMVTDGEQDVDSGWKLMSGGRTLISVGSSQVGLYHVKEPTDEAHPVTRGFADSRYQFIQKPIVFKCDQYVTCTTTSPPPTGQFCGLNNSSVGSPSAANPYFGNWNNGIRVEKSKFLNPEGNVFADGERYSIAGTVTVLDKAGKLYFKAAVNSVARSPTASYVDINFASRVPAFGTGSYNDSSDYIVIVEGLESVVPATSNAPEGTE